MPFPTGWQTPKTNWSYSDFLEPAALNRIEGNIEAIELGIRNVDQYKTLSSSNVSLSDFIDYTATLIRMITGEDIWIAPPRISLRRLNQLNMIDNLDFCKSFLYHTVIDYSKYADLNVFNSSVTDKFSGVVMVRGLLVFIPKSVSYLLVFNPAAGSIQTVSVAGGTDYWRGGAVCGTKVYAAPFNSDKILIFDISTYTVSYLTIPNVGASSGRFWGAVERNGKIYFVPHNATTILVLNTSNNSMYTIGAFSGGAQFAGGALAKGTIYLAPYNATVINAITPSDGIGGIDAGSGTAKYVGAAASLDQSRVYFAPFNASNILALDVDSWTTSTVSVTVSSNAFWGITPLPNGKFLLIPHSNSSALYFIPPSTVQQITISSETNKFCGGIIWLDGKVYLAPCNYSKIGTVYGWEYTVFDHMT